MNFNSIQYGIFLPIVFALYWALPHRFRVVLLFISSYYFYMSWNPKYVLLILTTTIVSYCAGRILEVNKDIAKRKITLLMTLVVCLGILFFFKYFNFVSESISMFFDRFAIHLNPITVKVLLPVGISFYTFQTLSYVIDVYKGKVNAEKNFLIYATFISFFPQLVAGPIERTENLLPQIKSEKQFDYEKAVYGMKLMTWGFFKKLAIADVVSAYVDTVFADLYSYRGTDLLVAVFFFTIQIYCDFSGYSDIAIGTAKLLGIDLMTNFKSPYLSASIREFWSRWHISLSTWFKDYVYIPMGGNRCSKLRNYLNLLVTFLVSGLWHGANWTFVIWGGLHGVGQIIEKQFDGALSKVRKNPIGKLISIAIVFVFCNILWIFFRADSLQDAIYVITNLFVGGSLSLGITKLRMLTIAFTIMVLMVFDIFQLKVDVLDVISQKPAIIRVASYAFLLLLIMNFRSAGEAVFVYFQF